MPVRSTINLSDEFVRGLPQGGPRQTYRDAELVGFCIRLPQFTWCYEYRPAGGALVKSMPIGKFPALKAAAARAHALRVAHAVKFDGRDPLAEKIAALG